MLFSVKKIADAKIAAAAKKIHSNIRLTIDYFNRFFRRYIHQKINNRKIGDESGFIIKHLLVFLAFPILNRDFYVVSIKKCFINIRSHSRSTAVILSGTKFFKDRNYLFIGSHVLEFFGYFKLNCQLYFF